MVAAGAAIGVMQAGYGKPHPSDTAQRNADAALLKQVSTTRTLDADMQRIVHMIHTRQNSADTADLEKELHSLSSQTSKRSSSTTYNRPARFSSLTKESIMRSTLNRDASTLSRVSGVDDSISVGSSSRSLRVTNPTTPGMDRSSYVKSLDRSLAASLDKSMVESLGESMTSQFSVPEETKEWICVVDYCMLYSHLSICISYNFTFLIRKH